MGKIDKWQQQAEGTIDEVKGELQRQSGDGIKGGISKTKGKLKKATAHLKDTDTDDDVDRL